MNAFLSGVRVILSLELRQRIRGTGWYVLLGIFVVLIGLVTMFAHLAFGGMGTELNGGAYSTIIYFVLLLGTLVAPALSGNAINGDREAGTLATTQITLVTTGQIVVGKFLAAWITALVFLAASVPFLVFATISGGLDAATILISLAILALELGVVAAVGVGLSGILNRPLFSIVVSYLVVAALSIGTLITFGLGGASVRTDQVSTYTYASSYDSDGQPVCDGSEQTQTETYDVARFDLFWGVLVANPYIVLADAVPTQYTTDGYPSDLFGNIKLAIRTAQVPPGDSISYNECDAASNTGGGYGTGDATPPREIIESTVPSWFVGLAIQIVLAGLALVGAFLRTRTPAGRLPKGSRIA